MATTINATSAGLSVSPDVSGQIQFQSGGTTIATVTPTGITTQVGAPAFSVMNNGTAQSVSNQTWTKVALNTKDFDTNSNFDATTNYRFQPTVAGYYQLSSFVSGPSNSTQNQITAIYKNGSIYKYLGAVQNLNATAVVNDGVSGSMLISLNGSTDYVELWVYQQTGSTVNTAGSAYLTGFLARSA